MDRILTWLFHIQEMPMSNELHNLLQSRHPRLKFTTEHSFKELAFLDILIKTKAAK